MGTATESAAGTLTVQRRGSETSEHSPRSNNRLDVERNSPEIVPIAEEGEHIPLLLAPAKAGAKGSANVIHLSASTANVSAPQKPPPMSAREFLGAAFAVGIWYACNIGLLCLNRYLLSSYGFRRPVFLTFWHMVCCCICASFVTMTRIWEEQPVKSWRHMGKIALLAVIFCFSVVGGNISLKFVPVSFNQAIGATTPAFTAVLGYLLYSKAEAQRVYCALIPVVGGIIITTGFEPSFNMAGLLFLLGATAARAYKSLLQGKLLEDTSEKMDSINLLKHMTPIAAVLLMAMVAIMEPDVLDSIPRYGSPEFAGFVTLLLVNGLLAFGVNLCNFLVTGYTSPLTLQVLGNVKGFFGAAISIAIFQNPWTWTGLGGYLVAIAGLFWYMRERRIAREASSRRS